MAEEKSGKTQRIGKSLRLIRHQRQLSQRALAERARIGQNLVVRAERGDDLRFSTLEKMAIALDMEILLVPREMAFTVQSLLLAYRDGRSLEEEMEKPLYALDEEDI